jgi:hypothetical protein
MTQYVRAASDGLRLAKDALDRQCRHHRRLLRQGHETAQAVGESLAGYNTDVQRAQDRLRAVKAADTESDALTALCREVQP